MGFLAKNMKKIKRYLNVSYKEQNFYQNSLSFNRNLKRIIYTKYPFQK
jgi:hypothetical protein